jgi:hypothetical protein
MTEQWAPFSPPDKFDDAAVEWMPTCVLASRGGRQGRGGGQDGDVFLSTLIMQLGSRSFFWRQDVGGSTHNNSYLKYGTHMMLRSV